NPETNPFDMTSRLSLQVFLLYSLLSVDILTPFLLHGFATCEQGDLPNAPKVLQQAANGLIAALEPKADITRIDDLREARTYSERLQKKGVARNQAQPRYHHLFELQLLRRVEGDIHGRRIVPYLPNDASSRAAAVLAPLREEPDEQQNLLDLHFFGWAAEIFAKEAKRCEEDVRRLFFFARGYGYLEREIGFTPGRTIALAGCLLA